MQAGFFRDMIASFELPSSFRVFRVMAVAIIDFFNDILPAEGCIFA
jgi:hypothetical protein